MHSSTVVYLGTDDLADACVSPVFTGQDGAPWATVSFGDPFSGNRHPFVLHTDPAHGANPLHLAECLERMARELRVEFSRWCASPDSDTWTQVRKVVAVAEAMTEANAG
jgi:hypothetical protein